MNFGFVRHCVVLAIALFFLASGCVTLPRGRSQINIDLVPDEDVFRDKVKLIEAARDKKVSREVFEDLRIPQSRFVGELPGVVQTLLWPGTNFQPHEMSELDDYELRLERFKEVYSFQLRDVDKWLKFELHKLNWTHIDEGFDHKVFMIFDKKNEGKLYKAFVAFVPVRLRNKVYIWEIGPTLITSILGSASSEGGKEAIRALGF